MDKTKIKYLKKQHNFGWIALYEEGDKLFMVDSCWRQMFFSLYTNDKDIWTNTTAYSRDIEQPATIEEFSSHVEAFIIKQRCVDYNMVRKECLVVRLKTQPILSEKGHTETIDFDEVKCIEIEVPDMTYDVYNRLDAIPIRIDGKEGSLIEVYITDKDYKCWYTSNQYFFFDDDHHTKEEHYKHTLQQFADKFKDRLEWGEVYTKAAQDELNKVNEKLKEL